MTISRRRFLAMGGSLAVPAGLTGCGRPATVPAADLPPSAFDSSSTAEDVTGGLDLSGKLAIVTGCTSGIGFETMRVLALRGAYVVGTGRDYERTGAACARVKGVTTPLALELGDFDSIARCTDTIRGMNTPIDILVCNAGMRGGEYTVTNGVERHFAVNHLGHFVFVYRLLERLYLGWQGRVVVVASAAGYGDDARDGIDFDDLAMRRDWSVARAYAHSKLANILFSLELARRLRGSRITSNALHPGVIATNILRDESGLVRSGFRLWTAIAGKSVEQGAATSAYVATNPALGAVSGRFFQDCNAVDFSHVPPLVTTAAAERLWDVSAELARDYLPELRRPDPDELRRGTWGDLPVEPQ